MSISLSLETPRRAAPALQALRPEEPTVPVRTSLIVATTGPLCVTGP